MRSSFSYIPVVLAAGALIGCSKDTFSPTADARVSVQDQCDPASFNAALGAGACAKQGSMTFAQFNSELNATHQVAAWRFVPNAFTIKVGQEITAMNDGGEQHTFTEVKAFGGGIVSSLNTASGNTQVAPECAALSANAMIASGGTFRTDPATDTGTELYQCCIHPWMRATVTVTD
jgi:plastocyanin